MVSYMYPSYGHIWNMLLQCGLLMHLQKDIAMLEKTQQFASRICTKNWDAGYHELLDMLDLPSLAQRRLHTRLCYQRTR